MDRALVSALIVALVLGGCLGSDGAGGADTGEDIAGDDAVAMDTRDATDDAADAEAEALDLAFPALPCAEAALPPAPVTLYNVATAVIGPCGHVAYTPVASGGGSAERLELLDPSGVALGGVALPGGGIGDAIFWASSRDAFLVVTQSDDGSAVATLVTVAADGPRSAPPVAVPSLTTLGWLDGDGVAGAWLCSAPPGAVAGALTRLDDEGGHELGAVVDCREVVSRGAVLAAPRDDGLAVWDVAAGTLTTWPGVATGWREEDGLRVRDRATLGGAGRWIAAQRVKERFPDTEPVGEGPVRAYDRLAPEAAPAEVAGDVSDVVVLEGTPGFVAAAEAPYALGWVAPSGATGTLADGSEPTLLGGGKVLARARLDGAPALVVLDLESGAVAPVVSRPLRWIRSPGGGTVAVTWQSDGIRPVTSIWRGGAVGPAVEAMGTSGPNQVAESGATFGYGGDGVDPVTGSFGPAGTFVRSPAGREVWSRAGGNVSAGAAGDAFVVTAKTVNQDVLVVDGATGAETLLVTGNSARIWLDAARRRVLVTYLPLSAAEPALHLAAVPQR